MLSLCYFVTVAGVGISQGMFQVVAGDDRVHNAARGGGGAFLGADLGAARCSWLRRLRSAWGCLKAWEGSGNRGVWEELFLLQGWCTHHTEQQNNGGGKDVVGKVLQATGETSTAGL